MPNSERCMMMIMNAQWIFPLHVAAMLFLGKPFTGSWWENDTNLSKYFQYYQFKCFTLFFFQKNYFRASQSRHFFRRFTTELFRRLRDVKEYTARLSLVFCHFFDSTCATRAEQPEVEIRNEVFEKLNLDQDWVNTKETSSQFFVNEVGIKLEELIKMEWLVIMFPWQISELFGTMNKFINNPRGCQNSFECPPNWPDELKPFEMNCEYLFLRMGLWSCRYNFHS